MWKSGYTRGLVEINGVQSYTSHLAGAVQAPCNHMRILATISSYLHQRHDTLFPPDIF